MVLGGLHVLIKDFLIFVIKSEVLSVRRRSAAAIVLASFRSRGGARCLLRAHVWNVSTGRTSRCLGAQPGQCVSTQRAK